jgi:hypothetical protein
MVQVSECGEALLMHHNMLFQRDLMWYVLEHHFDPLKLSRPVLNHILALKYTLPFHAVIG